MLIRSPNQDLAITIEPAQCSFAFGSRGRTFVSYVSSPFMHTNKRLVVFRSKLAILKIDERRLMGLKTIITLLEYPRSGNPAIEILHLASLQWFYEISREW